MPKLENYNRKLDYSYVLGVFPAMNFLQAHPQHVRRLLLHPARLGNEGVEKLRALCAQHNIREEQAERVLKRESKKDNCYAGLVIDKYDSDLSADTCHTVLCQISDAGNVGTALRSLLGFGIHDVALIRPCVDVFDPHVLRASMGAFSQMRVRTFDTFEEYRALYPERPLYPFMLDGAKILTDVAPTAEAPFTLVFGNEAAGLPPEFAQMGQSVFIPQSDEIDSLNLAVAVSIGSFTFMQEMRKNK